MRLFDLSQPFWQKIGKMGDIILLSFLWILCSLPIVTMGAASAALNRQVAQVITSYEGNLVKDFFHTFFAEVKRVTLVWIAAILLGGLLVVEMMFFGQIEGAMLAKVLVLVCADVLLVFVKCLFLHSAFSKEKARDLMQVCLYDILRYLPLYTAIVVAQGLILLLVSYEFQVFLVFLPGFYSWMECMAFMKLKKKEARDV